MSRYLPLFLTGVLLIAVNHCNGQFKRTWKYSTTGAWNGRAGMIIQDIDNDGQDEIISNAVVPNSRLTNYWFILDGQSNSLEKEQVYVDDIDIYPSENMCLTTQDDKKYLLVGYNMNFGTSVYNLRLEVIDLDLRQKVDEIRLDNVLEFLVHDYDKDSVEDLVVIKSDIIELYEIKDFKLKDSFHGERLYYRKPKFLDLDLDGNEEYIATSNNSFSIINLKDGEAQVEWEMSQYRHKGGYYDIDFYDYDNDGDLEIYMLIDSHIKIFDPSTKSLVKDFPLEDLSFELYNEDIATNFVIGSIIEGGEKYLIYKSLSHLLIVNPRTFSLLKVVEDNYGTGWTRNLWDIWLGDTNGDGYNEAIWTNGRSFRVPPPTHFYIHDLNDVERYWVSPSSTPFLYNFDIAISPSTKNKTIFLNQKTNFRDIARPFYMTEIDLLTKKSYSRSAVPLGSFKIIDADKDQDLEILVDNSKTLSIYDLPDFNLKTSNHLETPGGGHFQNLTQFDIDLDGDEEYIGCINTTSVGKEGGSHLIIMNDALEQEWFIPHIYTTANHTNNFVDQFHFEIGNIDSDPQPEIIVGITNYYKSYYGILIVDGLTQEYSLIDLNEYPISGMELKDLNNDGIMEAYLGTLDGIDVWRLDNKEIIDHYSFESTIGYWPLIENIEFYDFDDNGSLECVFTHDGMIKVVDTEYFEEIWQSEFIGARLAKNNSLLIDNNIDTARIYVGTEYSLEEYSYIGFTSTNTDDLEDHLSSIKVYPNPASKEFTIEVENEELCPCKYSIVDRNGNIYRQGEIKKTKDVIDINGLLSGLYFMQITNSDRNKLYYHKITILNE